MKKEKYLECKKILKGFLKKGYWTTFSSADIFYIQSTTKNKALFTFVEQFFKDAYGVQLFSTTDGFNYVHDILTTAEQSTVTLCDCDSICAIFVSRNDLKEEEINFLKSNKIRIMETNNLLIYRYQPGYNQRLVTDKELQTLLNHLEYLDSIIPNEYEDLKECFKEGNTAVCLMNLEEMQYAMVYRPLPYLETKIKLEKINVQFVEEFKDTHYVDDECYACISYIPVSIRESGIRPLLVYFSFPKLNKHYFKYILQGPKEYKNVYFGILYEVFTEIGVPIKMIFNNRAIYSLVNKTISALNIEHSFIRENVEQDGNVNDFIAKLYRRTNQDFVEDESILKELLETMTQALNAMNYTDDGFYDEDEDEDFIDIDSNNKFVS